MKMKVNDGEEDLLVDLIEYDNYKIGNVIVHVVRVADYDTEPFLLMNREGVWTNSMEENVEVIDN